MNIITKLFRDITCQYVWKTRKEKRYKASLQLDHFNREGNIASKYWVPVIMRDCPNNDEYYEILSWSLPSRTLGCDAPINKKNPKINIEIISEYEVEIKEKVYY